MELTQELTKAKKGQATFSLDVIINGLVTAAIVLIVGVYVVTVVGDQFAATSQATNNTIGNVTHMFEVIAPLLVVIGIIAFVAIILMFVRGGIAGQGGGRGGM